MKTYGGSNHDRLYDVEQTTDGGYIATGHAYSYGNAALVKFDSLGIVTWSRAYGSNAEQGRVVHQTVDGGYLFLAHRITGWPTVKYIIYRTDDVGDTLWTKQQDFQMDFADLELTDDGGFILVMGNFTNVIYKYDSLGNMQWYKEIRGLDQDRWIDIHDISQTSDGGYVLTGDWDYYNIFWLYRDLGIPVVKLDSVGSMEWEVAYGKSDTLGAGDRFGEEVVQTSDGGYIVVGHEDNVLVMIHRFNALGGLIWEKTINVSGWDEAFSIDETAGGNFLICGNAKVGLGSDILVIKINSTGNVLWSKTYSATGYNEEALKMDLTADGGFVIAGSSKISGGFWDMLLIKADSSGNVGCNVNIETAVTGADNPVDNLQFLIHDPYPNIVLPLYTEPYGAYVSQDSIWCTNVYSVSMSSTNVLCNGDCNGQAIATPSGGTPPFSYLWSNAGTTDTINNLCAGTYTVTVIDAVLDTVIDSITITEPTPLVIADSVVPSLCGGPNGEIWLTVSGSTAPYTYLWGNNATTANITGLLPGSYCVTVTDANSCTQDTCITVTISPLIPPTFTTTTLLCYGDCNGQATAIPPVVFLPPYTYQWGPNTGFQTTQTATGLCGGTYDVTITDTQGCTTGGTVTITGPPPLSFILDSMGNAACGDSTGFLSAAGTGGTPGYSYVWITGGTTQLVTGLSTGTYGLTITDSNGCWKDTSFSVGEDTVAISLTSATVSCNGDCDGTATTSVTSGVPPYIYQWAANTGFQTAQTATGLCAGIYTVTVTDSLACLAIDSITITEPSPLTIAITGTQPTGNCDGNASANPLGGTPPYGYQWDAAAGNQTTVTADSLCAGNYCVTVTDANNCTKDTCVDVPLGINEYNGNQSFTIHPNPTTGVFTVQGATGSIEVYDLFGRLVTESRQKEIDLSGQPSGIYIVKAGEAVRKLILH